MANFKNSIKPTATYCVVNLGQTQFKVYRDTLYNRRYSWTNSCMFDVIILVWISEAGKHFLAAKINKTKMIF